MRRDLRTIESDPDSLLARVAFTPSRTRPKSKNLVLHRKARISEKMVNDKINAGDDLTGTDVLVERIRIVLQDQRPNDANIRAIARAMPVAAINRGIHEHLGPVPRRARGQPHGLLRRHHEVPRQRTGRGSAPGTEVRG